MIHLFKRNRKRVWKMQRPVFTNGSYNEIMAYPEERDRTAIIPMDEEAINELFGEELKIYVVADVRHGKLNIFEILPEWEDW